MSYLMCRFFILLMFIYRFVTNVFLIFYVFNTRTIRNKRFHIRIKERINRTTLNLLLKFSHFFHDFQVNVLFTKIFLVLEALAINWKSLRKGEFCSIATIRVN